MRQITLLKSTKNLLGPFEAVVANRQPGARRSMAMHFGTFPLGDDGQREPLALLQRALKAANLSQDDFWVLDCGEGRNLPPRAM